MDAMIGFENHRVCCVIGVYEEERRDEQEVFIDLKVVAEISLAARTDRIDDTIDYVALAHICEELGRKNSYRLIETYASEVVQQIRSRYAVSSVWIRIKKPNALPTADFTFVELSYPSTIS